MNTVCPCCLISFIPGLLALFPHSYNPPPPFCKNTNKGFLTPLLILRGNLTLTKRDQRKKSSGFLRIFTVAFLIFLAPAGGSNPVGLIFNPTDLFLTLTYPKITPHSYIWKYEETSNFIFFPWSTKPNLT